MPDMVHIPVIPAMPEIVSKRITDQPWPWAKKQEYPKINKSKKDLAQVVESLPSKHEGLNSNPGTIKKISKIKY
jgi:hypothetical protein